ncbi:polysaccharide pyruvyl transferase family protein [Natronincola ferrireducens]|uniref:Polysaccharide pyruvyl transferase n=1 Tax=Natronincola ferrireducens TaxID=393762 RepID=A0A1G8X6J9_9FIRM|nr:polysaccharide pyruvyl transferase family protein [Natronincola ferrireducens]SDJ86017.1 Polysaccharide pyruvyl transferase [Natronincola ferrireducens]
MAVNRQEKSKIGVITYVRSNNWGTFLQAYATVKLLEKYLGDYYEVELIDITTRAKTTEGRKSKSLREILQYPKRFLLSRKLRKNHENIIKFYESNLKLSERFHSEHFNEALKFIKDRQYDILVSGSDEIWANKSGVDIPNIYYIPHEIIARKISIAPSANRGDLNTLTDKEKSYIKHSLSGYDYITVRDKNTYEFVTDLTDKKVSLIYDPTLGCEFEPVPHQKIRRDKKVIALMFGKVNPDVAQRIVERYGKKYKIVSIHSYIPKTEWLYIKDPLEFVSLYNEIDLMITSSYHGTIFSIKSDTSFISIDNESIYKQYSSKISDLLNRLKLEEHYQPILDNSEVEYEMLFKKIDKLLEHESSLNFNDAKKSAYDVVNNSLAEIRNTIIKKD